ncbi:hypothetical protein [Amycolatopsis azurea]|uniref:Uncharacterized protein n=1 Tax=Amycolatopsis azurea DSM 43854 TaxID=1238180 RepID=M2PF28_9PSEU|nr:hypothetical protein [Amycolatopsis azurea]EMD22933.1 hypothetical protein C791_7933 [Amycolatopsis azurea DSM 43854]OOC04294.1 hypothetical protein B0293_23860 [Amycolatopsis azurea DSM 43854]
MDARDRKLLAGMARVNTEIGRVTIALLSTQPDDAEYAAALRQVGADLVRVGASLMYRAAELDGTMAMPVDVLHDPRAIQGDLS